MLRRIGSGRNAPSRPDLTRPGGACLFPACHRRSTGEAFCKNPKPSSSRSEHSRATSNIGQEPGLSQRGQPPSSRTPAPARQKRWRIDSLVVVEGKADRRAVLNALDAPVVATSGAINDRTVEQLQKQMEGYPAMIILMDPDVAGRQARTRLSLSFPAALHSFVPQLEATSPIPSRWHDAGNIGVEHAPANAIRLALQAPRLLQPLRKDISREVLESLQLAGTFSDSLGVPPLLTAAVRRGLVAEQGAQAERRRRVTALLGLGDCNAKQLLRQLNTFSFSQGELQAAVQQVEAAMAAAASAPEILQYKAGDCSRSGS